MKKLKIGLELKTSVIVSQIVAMAKSRKKFFGGISAKILEIADIDKGKTKGEGRSLELPRFNTPAQSKKNLKTSIFINSEILNKSLAKSCSPQQSPMLIWSTIVLLIGFLVFLEKSSGKRKTKIAPKIADKQKR